MSQSGDQNSGFKIAKLCEKKVWEMLEFNRNGKCTVNEALLRTTKKAAI